MNNDLLFFTVQVKETLLPVHAQQNLKEKALKAVLKYRADIEGYMNRYPEFLISFQPLPVQEAAPEIVKEMLLAARRLSENSNFFQNQGLLKKLPQIYS